MFEHIITYYTSIENDAVRAHRGDAADEAHINCKAYCDLQDAAEPVEVPAWRRNLQALGPIPFNSTMLNGGVPTWR